jgi:hypothetical protein
VFEGGCDASDVLDLNFPSCFFAWFRYFILRLETLSIIPGGHADRSTLDPRFIPRGVFMDTKHGVVFSERVGSHSLVLSIPESKKAACFQELEQTIGPSKPISEVSSVVH